VAAIHPAARNADCALTAARGKSGLKETTTKELEREIDHTIEQLAVMKAEIGRVIFGQQAVVDEVLITLLAGGHTLLVGVPGLAKTKLAETLGRVLGMTEKRVQFTPDLMPGDIIGSEVLEEDSGGRQHFRFIEGPIFTQLLMADEINRASPRTQAALLQAMQERKVTVAGHDHRLPAPFHVLATQNPIEQEGTYPLPEAQLDRFLMQVNIDYPSAEAERQMMIATTTGVEAQPAQVIDGAKLMAMQALVRRLPVGEGLVEAILALVRAGRPESSTVDGIREQVAWGPGPRASQALMLVTRVRALLDGRLAPSLDDLRALAAPVLRHRMAVTCAARADDVVERLIRQVG
jgi:MoxR-like ATPase